MCEMFEATYIDPFSEFRTAARKNFDKVNLKRPIKLHEGVDLSSPGNLKRDELITRIDSTLRDQNYVFLRAAPLSGKTSLAQLLTLHYFENVPNICPISISCLSWPHEESFEIGFKTVSQQRYSLFEMSDKINPEQLIVLIVDEAQLLYHHIKTAMWENIKSGSIPANIKILFISFYGENCRLQNGGMPVMFNDSQRLGLADMLFDKENVSYYVRSNFELPNEFISDRDTNILSNSIYNSTNGHIGLLQLIVENMHTKVIRTAKKNGTNLRLTDLMHFLFSHHLNVMVKSSRCFDIDVNVVPIGVRESLKVLAFDSSTEIIFDSTLHAALVQGGVVFVDSCGHLKYTCPLVRSAFLSSLRSLDDVPVVQHYALPQNLSDFMLDCLTRFKKASFTGSNCTGLNCDNVRESKFQMEFYSVARSLLLSHLKIDQDVGHNFGHDLAVHFYINGKHNWAIEFLVDSDRLGEHIKRFKEGGKYFCVIPYLQHIVVNFIFFADDASCMIDNIRETDRTGSSKFKTELNYMRVYYPGDFSKIVVVLNQQYHEIMLS